jgi:hypothetical protein
MLRYLSMTELRIFATFTFTSRHDEDLNIVLLGYESWWEMCIMKNDLNRKRWCALVFGVSSKIRLRICRGFPLFVKSNYSTTKGGKTPSIQMAPSSSFMKHPPSLEAVQTEIQSDTKKRELLKNPTKIEEIKKKLLTEIEPLQLAFKRQ